MAVITGEATDVQLGRVNEELIKQLFSKPSKFDGHRFSALCEITLEPQIHVRIFLAGSATSLG